MLSLLPSKVTLVVSVGLFIKPGAGILVVPCRFKRSGVGSWKIVFPFSEALSSSS